MVLQERARWLKAHHSPQKKSLWSISGPHPHQPTDLFGAALTLMQKRWEEKERDDEDLKLCLLRCTFAPTSIALPHQHQTFVQAVETPSRGGQDGLAEVWTTTCGLFVSKENNWCPLFCLHKQNASRCIHLQVFSDTMRGTSLWTRLG